MPAYCCCCHHVCKSLWESCLSVFSLRYSKPSYYNFSTLIFTHSLSLFFSSHHFVTFCLQPFLSYIFLISIFSILPPFIFFLRRLLLPKIYLLFPALFFILLLHFFLLFLPSDLSYLFSTSAISLLFTKICLTH